MTDKVVVREAIKALCLELSDRAIQRGAEWEAAGWRHDDEIMPALMTVAVHTAAQIATAVAANDADPPDFIREAVPHMADQIEQYALRFLHEYVREIRKVRAVQ